MNSNYNYNGTMELDNNFTDCGEFSQNDTFLVPYIDPVLRQQFYLYVVPTMILLCVLGCIGNGAILLLIPWIRRPLFPILKLSLGLAAADCWTSLLLGAGFVINSFLPYVLHIELSHQACISLAIETFRLGAILTSLLHLLLLAVNHYLAIALPEKLGHVLRTGTIAIAMTLFWALPPAGFGISFAVIPDRGFQHAACRLDFLSQLSFRAMVVMLIVLPLLCMGVLYHRMVRILQQTQKRFKLNRAKSYTVSKKRRAMLTTLLILGSFLIAWIPSSVHFLLTSKPFYDSLWLPRLNLLIIVSSVINMLISLKLLLNPLIYALRIPEIKEALRRLLKQCFQSADDEIARKRSKFRLRSYKSMLSKGFGSGNNSRSGSFGGRNLSTKDFTTLANGDSTMCTAETSICIPAVIRRMKTSMSTNSGNSGNWVKAEPLTVTAGDDVVVVDNQLKIKEQKL